MIQKIMREIIPLTPNDCFLVFSREKNTFDFPLHYHEEMELTLIINGTGAKRIVGDHIGAISDLELVLVGSNLPHGWFASHRSNNIIKEVTIQFDKGLLSERLLGRSQFAQVRDMLQNAEKGILFSKDTTLKMATKIFEINRFGGFDLVLELFSLLHQLSVSQGQRTLSDSSFTDVRIDYHSRRIERVLDHINENFHRQICLADAGNIANMHPCSLSRFIKKRTGLTFVDLLNEVRLGHVSRMLIESNRSISEIAFLCGFSNMANFNRTFKRKKGCTPIEFKQNFEQERLFI